MNLQITATCITPCMYKVGYVIISAWLSVQSISESVGPKY